MCNLMHFVDEMGMGIATWLITEMGIKRFINVYTLNYR